MKKQPSPLVNPDNHCGSGIEVFNTKGLSTGIKLVNDSFNLLFIPLFIEAFIDTIFVNPSIFKCSLFKTKFIACLNKR